MKLPKGFGANRLGGMMGDIQSAMARAQNMTNELAAERVETATGPIKTVFDGNGVLISLKLDPATVDPDDVEMLEDMIVSAVRAGFEASGELREARTKEIMGNLPDIPGLPKF